MYSRPTAPKTIGGVLDDIFKLYMTALPLCWPIALLSAVISLAPVIYIGYLALQFAGSPEQAIAAFMSPAFWGSYLVIIAVSVTFSIALIVRTANVAEGEEGSFAQALARSIALFPRMFGASILYFLVLLAGLILLIVPGLIWAVSLCLSGALIVMEDSRAVESLSRSRALVKGNWWRTLAIGSVAMIVVALLMFATQFVGELMGRMVTADPLALIGITSVVSGVLNIVVAPLYSAVILGIYFDLKLRKEGDDLSDRVASLTQA